MIKELEIELFPREAADDESIIRFCSKKLNIKLERIQGFRIVRRSIDARKHPVKINLRVQLTLDQKKELQKYNFPVYQQVANANSTVIVVGAGPAGLFAALRLLELGIKPIIFERGKKIDERKRDLAQLNRNQQINSESNYGFGEGGAGTFSDGKLYTRSKKRGDINKVLEIFVQHGADESILIDTHPHIGTDKLPNIIRNMRRCIEKHGGEVHFEHKVVDLLLGHNEMLGVVLESGETYHGAVILATGHSARDVYELLHQKNVTLEAKSFAMGVRVEHPQALIDRIQYHHPEGRGEFLPAATYSFVTQVQNRGVYFFCMCPGGIIVPAATGSNQIVVNGMSASARGSKWANAGMVVELHPEDLPQEYLKYGVLAGLAFQKDLEETCYKQGGGNQIAPAQALKDFCEGIHSTKLPTCSYAPGIISSSLHEWLPPMIGKRLQEGFVQFARKAKGFITNEALIVGVESRTSSPVRIPRHLDSLEHITIKKLYPCGEGAGYSGGIISSAIDGIRCANQCQLQ